MRDNHALHIAGAGLVLCLLYISLVFLVLVDKHILFEEDHALTTLVVAGLIDIRGHPFIFLTT